MSQAIFTIKNMNKGKSKQPKMRYCLIVDGVFVSSHTERKFNKENPLLHIVEAGFDLLFIDSVISDFGVPRDAKKSLRMKDRLKPTLGQDTISRIA